MKASSAALRSKGKAFVTHHKHGGRCPSGPPLQRWLPHTCMSPCHWAGHWAVPAPGPPTAPATGAQHPQAQPRLKQSQGSSQGSFQNGTLALMLLPSISLHTPVFSSNPDLQKQNSNFMPVPRELLAFSRLCRIWTPLPASHQLQTYCHTFCLCLELSPQNTNSPSSTSVL